MITTSQAWKDYSRDVGIFHIKAVIDNGTQMTLTDEDFMQGSVNITDSISGMSDFNVGAVITNSFNATLNNFSGKFNNYNLAGARISVQFGIIFDDESEEWIDRGTYTLEKPTSLGSTIKVVGYDDMDKLNRYYIGKDGDGNDITFPIGSDDLADKICAYCGVSLDGWDFQTFYIDEFEYDESTTCRQVLSWIVQASGGYARISPYGFLDGKKFNANVWTIGVEMQGGIINPWNIADVVNGGSMNPWSAVTNYNGGTSGNIDFTLSKIKSLNVYVEDIAVTGVRAYAYNTVDEFQFDTVGTGGYVLAIQDNPLVTDNTLAVATRVYNATKDLKFRPFDASIIGDPSIEAGDIIALQDYLGNVHVSLITSLTYSVNSAERLECNAKTPEEADLETANPQTSVIKGATMAAYDYITAKKISADYISAGTMSGAVEATNFTMSGGTIDIETDDDELDIIKLNIQDTTNWKDYVDIRGNSITLLTKDGEITPGGTWEQFAVDIQAGHPGGGGAVVFAIYTDDEVNGQFDILRIVSSHPATGQIYILGNQLKDFVVEEGTSNGWDYRIWHSGKKECWYRDTKRNVAFNAWGSGYSTAEQTVPNYPFTFDAYPNVQMTAQVTNGGGWVLPNYTNYSVNNCGSYYVGSLASGSRDFTINIYASGK